MSTEELLPGTLRVVTGGALVRKWGSEEEHYTQGMQIGTVINKLHAWVEPGQHGDKVYPCYLVLFSNDSRMYVVPGNHLAHPDHVKDPGRLFGAAHGLAHK
jgi:hypothetical protein